ncbi:hypothetical protein EDD17DRAFT_1149286 [Pisolithus thermaeus]|nr:hypothetical protein EDD17DRAFT_1149286 [Pisolithus thermaeus]
MPSKKEMQQAYRSKETQGFQDLHCALQAADPHQPIQRDVARYQLLSMAARRLRELTREKQELSQELSGLRQQSPRPPATYIPHEFLCTPDQGFPCMFRHTTLSGRNLRRPVVTSSIDSGYDDGCMPYPQEMRNSAFNVINTDSSVHSAYYGSYYTTGRV